MKPLLDETTHTRTQTKVIQEKCIKFQIIFFFASSLCLSNYVKVVVKHFSGILLDGRPCLNSYLDFEMPIENEKIPMMPVNEKNLHIKTFPCVVIVIVVNVK